MNYPQIPIINYHKIEVQTDIGVTTRHPDQFLKDMTYLAENNFTPITFYDLTQEKTIFQNPIIITFDDGYESIFELARPILNELGFRAVVFVPLHFLGKYNDWDVQFGSRKYKHMSAQQIKQMSLEGFEIASHGLQHVPFTSLDSVPLSEELSQSKLQIESICNTEVVSICYPFGRFDQRIIQAVKDAGYQYGLGSLYYKKLSEQDKRWALPRFNIYRFDTDFDFSRKITANYHSLIGYRDWLIQLGGRATPIYQKLRRKA